MSVLKTGCCWLGGRYIAVGSERRRTLFGDGTGRGVPARRDSNVDLAIDSQSAASDVGGGHGVPGPEPRATLEAIVLARSLGQSVQSKAMAVLKRIGLSPKSAIAMRRAFRMRSTYYFQRILFRYMIATGKESPDEYVACLGYAWRRYRHEKTKEGIGVIQRTCLLRTMFVPSECLQ